MRWVKKRYYHAVGQQQWRFCGEVKRRPQGLRTIDLQRLGEVTITRQVKLQGEANPYDPAWEEYYDCRLGLTWLRGARRTSLVRLWRAQEGVCSICPQNITKETGWHVHHRRHRVHGGGDHPANLALLHPNGHRQLHSQGLTVVKPGPIRGL